MSKFTNFFEAFTKLNVLIVGDAMIDHYLVGKVNRISPEAPVPVVLLDQEEYRLGGAANVALNIKALGANPIIATVLGKDKESKIFKKLMAKEGLSVEAIVESKQRMTTLKTRILAKNQQLLRVDRESTQELSAKEEQHLLERCRSLINEEQIDVLVFQDYNKGVLTPFAIHELISLANFKNIPVAVDPKYANFFEYRQVALFKPNLAEVNAIVPFEVNGKEESQLEKAATYIREKLNNYFTLITLSDKGIYLNTPEGGIIIPTEKRNIADVSGAGDTVLSVVALGLTSLWSIQEVVNIANYAGGIVCEKVGVVPIDKEQLIAELEGE